VLGAGSAFGGAEVNPYTNIITRFAGNGFPCQVGSCRDGSLATDAALNDPHGIAVNKAGNMFIADTEDNQIREVSASGIISTFAGTATQCANPPACGDGGPAKAAQLSFPAGVAVAPDGTVYIADWFDEEVRAVSPSGKISRFAGTGKSCTTAPACGDGGPATSAQLRDPQAVAVDSHGNVYIADSADNEVRMVSPSGIISRVAGTGSACSSPPSCGDGGPATSARLSGPRGVSVDGGGNLYIADTEDNEVRMVSPAGTISRLAGTGAHCPSSSSPCGDGGSALSAQLSAPYGVMPGNGGVYVSDTGDSEVRFISGATITRFAGNGRACAQPPAAPPDCGDGQPAADAEVADPEGLAIGSGGRVFIADANDNEIRQVARGRRPTPPPEPPTISRLRVKPAAVALHGRLARGRCVRATRHNRLDRRCRRHLHLRISYSVNVFALVKLSVYRAAPGRIFKGSCVPLNPFNRHGQHCHVPKSLLDVFQRSSQPGGHHISWNGRAGRHRLRPGTYVVTASVLGSGPLAEVAFTVKR
jgi:sugar lactone lactonase YvrE